MAKKQSSKTNKSPASNDPAAQNSVNFEDAIAEVEAIVAKLESGGLGLAESLQQYETGVKRLKQCHHWLVSAEQRVSVLAGFDADGTPVTEPLSELEVRGSGRETANSSRRSATKKSKMRGDGTVDALSNIDDEESVDDSPGLF